MVEGQILPSYITLKNTGTTAWGSATQLATTAPRGRTSVFAASDWVSPSSAAAVKGTVLPGASYKFQFDLQAPAKADTYFEHFGLMDDTASRCVPVWFGDPGQGGPEDDDIEVQIVVIAPQYRGTFLAQSYAVAPATVSVAKGGVVSGWVELTNTGTQPWVSGTTKLAPIPRDTASPFADSSWLSTTRISTIPADVAPGDVGEFEFKLDTSGAGAGAFTVEFGLIEEGVTWFSDPTLGGGPADGVLRIDLVVGSLDAGAD